MSRRLLIAALIILMPGPAVAEQQDLASANALQAQELKRQLALLDQEHDAQQHDWQLQQMPILNGIWAFPLCRLTR